MSIIELADEIRVNNCVLVLGAGASFQAGMPLYKQIAPAVWQVIDEYSNLKPAIGGTPDFNRLYFSKQEKTPWLFNYALRGGWNYTKSQYQEAKEYERSDILLALIAAKQILSLDKEVDHEWLKKSIAMLGFSDEWLERSLDFSKRRGIVLDGIGVRIIHIEAAERLLMRFIGTRDETYINEFAKIIQEELISAEQKMLGIVWFGNRISHYDISYYAENLFFSENIIDILVKKCFMADTSTARRDAAFFLRDIPHRTNSNIDIKWIVENHPLLYDWIESVDRETAYAYSDLLNCMINQDKKHLFIREFVSGINMEILIDSIKKIDYRSLYEWSHFIDRLGLFQTNEWKKQFLSLLPQKKMEAEALKCNDVYGISALLSTIHGIDKSWSYRLLEQNMPKLLSSLNKDPVNTWIDLESNYFQYAFLGYKLFKEMQPNKRQKKNR